MWNAPTYVNNFYLSYSFIFQTVFYLFLCDWGRLSVRYTDKLLLPMYIVHIPAWCVLYNHVKMTYTAAKTNMIEGSAIKNTRVADRMDFSLNDFRKNAAKNVYICTCMRIIHLHYNVTRFMYRNGWTHKSHRSYFSPRQCYFLSNSHRFFACFHYYNIIYSPWHRVVFWSKKQFGSARMI